MAWFSYKCPECGSFKKSLPKREQWVQCPQCNHKDCVAILKVGSIQVVERLDNGAMARAVERVHNIEEIMEDRADKHTDKVMKELGVEEETE